MPTEIKPPDRLTRLFKGEVDDVSKSKRTITSIITTDAIDRYKEVIVARGLKLDNYQANPVVLWGHNTDNVIGKNLGLARKTKGDRQVIIAKTWFAKTDFASEIFELYADEILNGWSIGCKFIDHKSYGPPTEDEIKARPELKDCHCVYRKLELIEYSAVSIPANPEALGNEIGKKISTDLMRQIKSGPRWDTDEPPLIDEVREPKPGPVELPPLLGRTFHQAVTDMRNAVRGMTTREAAEAAAKESIDRLKGRV